MLLSQRREKSDQIFFVVSTDKISDSKNYNENDSAFFLSYSQLAQDKRITVVYLVLQVIELSAQQS
jgi:hypothetical protein